MNKEETRALHAKRRGRFPPVLPALAPRDGAVVSRVASIDVNSRHRARRFLTPGGGATSCDQRIRPFFAVDPE